MLLFICKQEGAYKKEVGKMKKRIEEAIKKLNLKEEELKQITYGNMEKICKMAKVDMLDLMKYLRYER